MDLNIFCFRPHSCVEIKQIWIGYMDLRLPSKWTDWIFPVNATDFENVTVAGDLNTGGHALFFPLHFKICLSLCRCSGMQCLGCYVLFCLSQLQEQQGGLGACFIAIYFHWTIWQQQQRVHVLWSTEAARQCTNGKRSTCYIFCVTYFTYMDNSFVCVWETLENLVYW